MKRKVVELLEKVMDLEDAIENLGVDEEEDNCEGCFFHEIELRTGLDCGIIQKVLDTAAEIREERECCE